MTETSFGFPPLEIKEIINYLRTEIESDIDISEKDFREPQKERWLKFYTLMLCDCCLDLSPDTLHMMMLSSSIEHKELHDDSAPVFNVLKCMQSVLETCGVADFKISDILFPKSKRLINFCSAIINFRRFQDERIAVYKDIQGETDALQDQRDSLLKENEEFQQKINNLKMARAEKEPEIEMLKEEIAKEVSSTEQSHEKVTALQTGINEKKTQVAEQKLSVANLTEQLAKLKQENNHLTSQIVPSPDRLKGEMQRMENQVKQLQFKKDEALQASLELKERRQLQQRREPEFEQAIKLITAVKEQMDKQRSCNELLAGLKDEAISKHDDIKSLDAQTQHLNLRLSILQENIEKNTIIYNSKVKEMKNFQERLKQDLYRNQESKDAEEKAKQSLLEEKHKLEQQQEEERKSFVRDITRLRDMYFGLLNELDAYHKRLASECQKVRRTTEM